MQIISTTQDGYSFTVEGPTLLQCLAKIEVELLEHSGVALDFLDCDFDVASLVKKWEINKIYGGSSIDLQIEIQA